MSTVELDEEAAAIASAEAAADRLADTILAGAEAPDVAVYVALRGWIAFAKGSGAFTPSARHTAALCRLPPEAELLAWNIREGCMAAMRDAG